jgi:hypothetical protein
VDTADYGKRLQLTFDGVMASPKVYLNGKEVGSWIYGYNSAPNLFRAWGAPHKVRETRNGI